MDEDEKGFTLVELLVVLALTSILLTLAAGALRHYSRGRALDGGRAAVVTQMRLAQQRSSSESFPVVYGVRFEKGTSRWAVVRYVATTGACTVSEQAKLDGVIVATSPSSTDFPESAAADACRAAAPAVTAQTEVAFFYPRGSATGGTVGITSPALGKTLKVTVNAATGRVEAV